MAKTYNWTVRGHNEFGTMGSQHVQPSGFVRLGKNGLYYAQWADAYGRPEKGAGRLFNPEKFVIGQTSARRGLEALGLK